MQIPVKWQYFLLLPHYIIYLLQIAGLLQQKSSFWKDAEVFFSWFFQVLTMKSKNHFQFHGKFHEKPQIFGEENFWKDAEVAKELQFVVWIWMKQDANNMICTKSHNVCAKSCFSCVGCQAFHILACNNYGYGIMEYEVLALSADLTNAVH